MMWTIIFSILSFVLGSSFGRTAVKQKLRVRIALKKGRVESLERGQYAVGYLQGLDWVDNEVKHVSEWS